MCLPALQDRTVEVEVWTGDAIYELSQIRGGHAPASEFPVEDQQRGACGGGTDAQILGDEIAVHQSSRHHLTDFLHLAPERFESVEVRSNIAQQRGIFGQECAAAQVIE